MMVYYGYGLDIQTASQFTRIGKSEQDEGIISDNPVFVRKGNGK